MEALSNKSGATACHLLPTPGSFRPQMHQGLHLPQWYPTTRPNRGLREPAPERQHVFISYSHADRAWVERLRRMMAPMLRDSGQMLRLWDDNQIRPGAKWRDEIEMALAQAEVALLLVSDHFLASEFVMGQEVPKLLAAAKAEGVPILWVSLSPCLVEHTPIHQYQAVLPVDQHLAGLDEVGRLEALKKISLTIEKVMSSQKQTREASKQSASFENTTFVQSLEEEDLDCLWEQVIGKIELPSTRILFFQQSKLLQLDSDRALVGVNERWLTMVQSRLFLLEKAIAITLGSRRVTLIGQHDVHAS
jgi:hypothetical protein